MRDDEQFKRSIELRDAQCIRAEDYADERLVSSSKMILVLNGGSIIVMVALLGAIPSLFTIPIAKALYFFSFGAAFAPASLIFNYLRWRFRLTQQRFILETVKDGMDNSTQKKIHLCKWAEMASNALSTASIFSSLILFVIGLLFVSKEFNSFISDMN